MNMITDKVLNEVVMSIKNMDIEIVDEKLKEKERSLFAKSINTVKGINECRDPEIKT